MNDHGQNSRSSRSSQSLVQGQEEYQQTIWSVVYHTVHGGRTDYENETIGHIGEGRNSLFSLCGAGVYIDLNHSDEQPLPEGNAGR